MRFVKSAQLSKYRFCRHRFSFSLFAIVVLVNELNTTLFFLLFSRSINFNVSLFVPFMKDFSFFSFRHIVTKNKTPRLTENFSLQEYVRWLFDWLFDWCISKKKVVWQSNVCIEMALTGPMCQRVKLSKYRCRGIAIFLLIEFREKEKKRKWMIKGETEKRKRSSLGETNRRSRNNFKFTIESILFVGFPPWIGDVMIVIRRLTINKKD